MGSAGFVIPGGQTLMPYKTDRDRDGRWVIIDRGQCPGIVYTDDDEVLGFSFMPKVAGAELDPTPMLTQIDANYAAGLTATQAFELIAANSGSQIDEGDLRTWRKTRMRKRPDMSSLTRTDAAEVKAVTRIDD
ncbi:hypothetical protein [Gordonia amicalis]|uniref:Uncharacterized protein n=1 Tax=Gordonia amicalis TaxID=89053 RepID=A0ABU4DJK7_9ACTN|nr:hypothetical protein [Gordonia amicalis]MDV6309922.1 hypothetical protein [Gordonia amicalis]